MSVPARIETEVMALLQPADPLVLARFSRFLYGRRARDIDNADELLEQFARREDWRRRWDWLALAMFAGLPGVFVSLIAGTVGPLDVALVVLAGFVAFAALRAFDARQHGYLGRAELGRARADQNQSDRPDAGRS